MGTVLNFLLVSVDLQGYLFNLFHTVTFREYLLYPMLHAKHYSGRSSCNNDLKLMKQVLLLYSLANEKIRTQRITYFNKRTFTYQMVEMGHNPMFPYIGVHCSKPSFITTENVIFDSIKQARNDTFSTV